MKEHHRTSKNTIEHQKHHEEETPHNPISLFLVDLLYRFFIFLNTLRVHVSQFEIKKTYNSLITQKTHYGW